MTITPEAWAVDRTVPNDRSTLLVPLQETDRTADSLYSPWQQSFPDHVANDDDEGGGRIDRPFT